MHVAMHDQLSREGTARMITQEDQATIMLSSANPFDGLPLLISVPRAAGLLGLSRAAAYRYAAAGDLPVKRLGGRIYVVTAGIRRLVAVDEVTV
jgi:hypothetical protein